MSAIKLINPQGFYNNYYGHSHFYLSQIIKYFNTNNENVIVYFAGDSTLDNKHWIDDKYYYPAINSYENIFKPTIMKGDFSYYLNKEFVERNYENYKVVNCAREASAFSDKNELCEQDKIILNNIKEQDILIVSIGGNDLALLPSFSILINFITLNYFNRSSTIDDISGSAWGLQSLVKSFKEGITKYIKKLVAKTKPSKIIVCMFYYPDANWVSSWCGFFLDISGYTLNQKRVQAIIRQIYNLAIKEIKIRHVEMRYFPMFEYLDPNNSNDYIGRVEPSEQGTAKMSKGLVDLILSQSIN